MASILSQPAISLPITASVGATEPDSSATVKGLVKLATAPAVASNPLAVGDNDARNTNSRAPTAHTATHLTGGADPIALVTGSANGLARATDNAKLATIQGGAGTLVAGTVTITTATISGSSSIVVTRKTAGGTVGSTLAVPASGRTVGVPGSSAFVVNSLDSSGSFVNTDTSTFDWHVIN